MATAKAVFGVHNQKDLFRDLFQPGGAVWSLFRGAPDAGYEAGVSRGLQGLNQNLSQQGLFGSPLGARAAMNYAGLAAQGRDQNRFQNMLSATRPIGAGGGGGNSTMSMFGI